MKKITISAILGLATFLIVNILEEFTGIYLVASFINLAVAMFLGVPGVITLTLFNYVIM